jgi:putative ABC transport system permease protein
MYGYKAIKGRYINKLDNDERRKVAVIGSRVYEHLFINGEDPVGEQIEIGGISFTVVGVFSPDASTGDSDRTLEMVLVPNATLQYTFNQVDRVGSMRLKPKPGVHAATIEKKAIEILRERTFVHPVDH